MCSLKEEINHKNQSKMGWLGGGCNFKKDSGMKAVAKGIE
jgi:hypothetical protein